MSRLTDDVSVFGSSNLEVQLRSADSRGWEDYLQFGSSVLANISSSAIVVFAIEEVIILHLSSATSKGHFGSYSNSLSRHELTLALLYTAGESSKRVKE